MLKADKTVFNGGSSPVFELPSSLSKKAALP